MIMFFGCGTHREEAMMSYITGNDFRERLVEHGILKDFILCIQNIDHVPDENISDDENHLSVRSIIMRNWGDGFKNYIAKPKQGGTVHGSIWQITEDEYSVLRYWELVDYGWYDEAEVAIETAGGGTYSCRTVCLRDGHSIATEVKGSDYNPWLQPESLYKKIAKESRFLHSEQLANEDR